MSARQYRRLRPARRWEGACVRRRRSDLETPFGGFAGWLCHSLDREAAEEATGALPAVGGLDQIWLTEVEAVGLLVISLDAEAHTPSLRGAAGRLAARLYDRVNQVRPAG